MSAPGFQVTGAPAVWTIGPTFQIARGDFVVLAMSYPANTQFSVNLESVWWKISGNYIVYPTIPMASSKSSVFAPVEDLRPSSEFVCTGQWYDFCSNFYKAGAAAPGLGAWFFENIDANTGIFYIRVVSPAAYNGNQRAQAERDWFYSADSVRVPRISSDFQFRIQATNAAATSTSYAGGLNSFFTVADVIPAAFPASEGTQLPSTPASRSSVLVCGRGTILNGGAPAVSNPFPGGTGGFAAALGVPLTLMLLAIIFI